LAGKKSLSADGYIPLSLPVRISYLLPQYYNLLTRSRPTLRSVYFFVYLYRWYHAFIILVVFIRYCSAAANE